jgi:hypothetical protein
LHDERDAIILDEEVADEAALRGAADELTRIADLPCEHFLRAAGRIGQLGEVVLEA